MGVLRNLQTEKKDRRIEKNFENHYLKNKT